MISEWVGAEWIGGHAPLLWWLGGISLFTFVASLVVIPLLVVRMAPDYFMPDRVSAMSERHPLVCWLGLIGKNVLGAIIFVAGVAMLFIPGQGLLTMLLGLALLNFPGKRGLELRLVRLPKIHRSLDWIRARYGRPPLQVPPL